MGRSWRWRGGIVRRQQVLDLPWDGPSRDGTGVVAGWRAPRVPQTHPTPKHPHKLYLRALGASRISHTEITYCDSPVDIVIHRLLIRCLSRPRQATQKAYI